MSKEALEPQELSIQLEKRSQREVLSCPQPRVARAPQPCTCLSYFIDFVFVYLNFSPNSRRTFHSKLV